MVFQSYALYPHMTVAENMGFALKLQGRDKATINKLVTEAADILALGQLLDRLPKQLSGGQRQRGAGRSCGIRRSSLRFPRTAWPTRSAWQRHLNSTRCTRPQISRTLLDPHLRHAVVRVYFKFRFRSGWRCGE